MVSSIHGSFSNDGLVLSSIDQFFMPNSLYAFGAIGAECVRS